MENTHSAEENNKNTRHDGLFGVSSDDIIDLLHQGELADVTNTAMVESGPEKDQIVNQQDQLDIINPSEEETTQALVPPATETPADPKPADIIEREKIPGDKEISGQLVNEQTRNIKPES